MTEKKIIIALLLLTVLAAFSFIAGCGTEKPEREHLLIAATIYPYELILNDLVTEGTVVKSIIPASASPHTFSPKPEDIKLLEDADLIISNGAGLEQYLEDKLRDLGDKHIEVFHLIRDQMEITIGDIIPGNTEVRCCPPEESGPGSSDKSDSHINPHFWLDPLNASTIASEIAEALILIDPDNEDFYRENLDDLRTELNQTNTKIMLERAAMGDISVLNFHDAFYYFNKRYSIHSAGVIVRSPGKEPTAPELVEIGKQIKENDVKAIFIEPQLNPKAAEVIAKEFGLAIVEVDPIGSKETVRSLAQLVEYNWNAKKSVFK